MKWRCKTKIAELAHFTRFGCKTLFFIKYMNFTSTQYIHSLAHRRLPGVVAMLRSIHVTYRGLRGVVVKLLKLLTRVLGFDTRPSAVFRMRL